MLKNLYMRKLVMTAVFTFMVGLMISCGSLSKVTKSSANQPNAGSKKTMNVINDENEPPDLSKRLAELLSK